MCSTPRGAESGVGTATDGSVFYRTKKVPIIIRNRRTDEAELQYGRGYTANIDGYDVYLQFKDGGYFLNMFGMGIPKTYDTFYEAVADSANVIKDMYVNKGRTVDSANNAYKALKESGGKMPYWEYLKKVKA